MPHPATPALACTALLLAVLPAAAVASEAALIATRTLRAAHVIAEGDLAPGPHPARPGLVTDPAEALGMEARVTLYAGRPVPLASLSPPALVERNQLVTLLFRTGSLEIRAEGRALGRGAGGDVVRVMNLSSRNTLSGRVAGPGLIVLP
jgi:flagellar basal body P-ring formation protein FlgA